MDVLRARLTYANVMSTVALFIALGGVSYAAVTIPNNSVGTKQIKNRAVTKSKLNPRLLSSLAGKTGPQGLPGARGPAAADGQNGAPGPSDTYVAGKALQAVTTLPTEFASVTVPAGSYLLGATMWVAQQSSVGGDASQVTCKLEPSDPTLILWDESDASLVTTTSTRSSLSLAGADTFTADQTVKVFCSTSNTGTGSVNAVNVRLWAIKTGNLHATLPLPHD